MATAAPFVAHCLELFAPLGVVRVRRMFGGHGVDVDNAFMALIADGVLYLKADVGVQAQFQAAGCAPFSVAGKQGERVVMGYWSAPEDAMESPAQMHAWALLALGCARRAAQAKAGAAQAGKTRPGTKTAAKTSTPRSTAPHPRRKTP